MNWVIVTYLDDELFLSSVFWNLVGVIDDVMVFLRIQSVVNSSILYIRRDNNRLQNPVGINAILYSRMTFNPCCSDLFNSIAGYLDSWDGINNLL